MGTQTDDDTLFSENETDEDSEVIAAEQEDFMEDDENLDDVDDEEGETRKGL